MGRQRRSEASRVLEYFQTQPLELAKEILDLCQEALKRRGPQPVKVKKSTKPYQAKGSGTGNEGVVGE